MVHLILSPSWARFPETDSASSTAALKVWSGGSAQSSSSRTLAEVYAASITAVGVGSDNLSGTWTCPLQAANILETVSYGDGPAGALLALSLQLHTVRLAAWSTLQLHLSVFAPRRLWQSRRLPCPSARHTALV